MPEKPLILKSGYFQGFFHGFFWFERAFSIPPFCAPTLCHPPRVKTHTWGQCELLWRSPQNIFLVAFGLFIEARVAGSQFQRTLTIWKNKENPSLSGHYSHDRSESVSVIGVISEPIARELRS